MSGLRYIEDAVSLEYDSSKCRGCRRCVEVCPHGAFAMDGSVAVLVDRGACIECGACRRNCAYGAISVNAGVGCAAAIINGWIHGTEPTCDCTPGDCC